MSGGVGCFPAQDAVTSTFGSAASPLSDGPRAQNPACSVRGRGRGRTQAQVAKRLVHSVARLGLASETKGLSGGGGPQEGLARHLQNDGEVATASDLLPSKAGSSQRLARRLQLPRGQLTSKVLTSSLVLKGTRGASPGGPRGAPRPVSPTWVRPGLLRPPRPVQPPAEPLTAGRQQDMAPDGQTPWCPARWPPGIPRPGSRSWRPGVASGSGLQGSRRPCPSCSPATR